MRYYAHMRRQIYDVMKWAHVQSALIAALFLLVGVSAVQAEESIVHMPGTQPSENGIEIAKVAQCMMCHSQTPNGESDPYQSWQGGMMAQAARDPVFHAAMTIANQDVKGVGEYCLRCHSTRGWLEGRSVPADGSALNVEDKQGVSCDVCHRLVDPLSDEAKLFAKEIPPGYGNAMVVADPGNIVRGPYGDSKGAMPHKPIKSEFHASSELCANCHNVSNPLQAEDVNTQPPYAYGVIERTYSEWRLSDFAKRGAEGTCQSCHYPQAEGGGQASRFTPTHRDYFPQHGPVGGSTWVQDAVVELAGRREVDANALAIGKRRTVEFLKTAAKLDLTINAPDKATLRITNLTGHKLPTGYPEGRRMWIHATFIDADGKVLKEVGRYGDKQDTLKGEAVTVPTLLDEQATRVYECLPAISAEQAKKFGKAPGKSFHFVLNDTIAKDNRIPPEGFSNEAFAEHLCQPVDATYADGQYWDDVEFALPAGTASVKAQLMYQSVSWEYLKFLVETNTTDDTGQRLYDVWTKTGYCEPTVMAEVVAKVGG